MGTRPSAPDLHEQEASIAPRENVAEIRVLQVIGGSKFGGGVWVIRSYVETLLEHGCTVAVCTSVRPVADVFRALGCEIVSVTEMGREIDLARDLLATIKLARICRSGQFDVVHTHTSKGGFVGRAAARLAGVPIVLHTAHGFAFHESSSRSSTTFYATLERTAARWCDRVITVSEFHRKWAIRLRIAAPERIVTIRNGISRSRLTISRDRPAMRAELGVETSDVLLVCVGRLAPEKGLETLILALPEILRRAGRARLLLAGDGPLLRYLETQVSATGLSSAVRFLGFRSDIGDLLNASDVVIAPSLREGLSILVLEAMAMGKAIVATTIGSNLELVEDQVSGLLVSPNDHVLLSEAIIKMAEDRVLAGRYGDAARQRFDQDFSEQTMKKSLWALYRDLLTQKLPMKSRAPVPRLSQGERKPYRTAESPAPTIRPMQLDDVAAVVGVHLRAFPGFFLSFLGPRFLAVLYRSAIEAGEIAIVADRGRITGLAMGTADPAAFFRKLLRKHAAAFAISALPAVLRRPSTALRVARALQKPHAVTRRGAATLLSVAVDPAFQTGGQGRILVEAFIDECKRRGASRVDLTTDKHGNDRVNAFYSAMGFRVEGQTTTPEGRVMYEYVLDLTSR